MKKGRIFSVLIVIVLITISFTGCFSDDGKENNDDELSSNDTVDIINDTLINLSFRMEISIENLTEYKVICPIPIISAFGVSEYADEGKPVDLLSELYFITGNGTFRIIDTAYGLGLEIISQEYLILFSQNLSHNKYNLFSEISSNYFYFESNNQTNIRVNYSAIFLSNLREFSWKGVDIDLLPGWQNIDLLINQTIAN